MASLQFTEPAGTIRASTSSATAFGPASQSTGLRLVRSADQATPQQQQPQLFHRQAHAQASSPSLQNQRVASIIQATGHPTTSSAFTNRFSSSAQNQHPHQFYASSAPSSSAALSLQNQNQKRPSRPPVPLFSQSTGNIHQGKMNIQDLELDMDDFVAFEGGASTTAYSSPALQSVFDLSGSVSSSTNMGTVSPQDLLIQEPFMSAPNSSALTALTSPSMYGESPDFDSFDVSPNFGSHDLDAGSDVWYPLFPQANPQQELHQPAANAEQSPATGSEDLEVVETAPSQKRKPGHSPPTGRHSSVAGVNSRRRDKPLPPIIVEDSTDTVAMKRARNTLAARKSRERKAQRFEELEEKIDKLTADRDYWKNLALSHGAPNE
ncbi:putative control protein [Cercophora scortea]|uniref:Cross-pathway control protein 1 n=1 Tax=Cercophora scortea TaxID=314031 RepID=A0AAE0J060_9PEZI|nr:putative control protein [Cercophora scortea]